MGPLTATTTFSSLPTMSLKEYFVTTHKYTNKFWIRSVVDTAHSKHYSFIVSKKGRWQTGRQDCLPPKSYTLLLVVLVYISHATVAGAHCKVADIVVLRVCRWKPLVVASRDTWRPSCPERPQQESRSRGRCYQLRKHLPGLLNKVFTWSTTLSLVASFLQQRTKFVTQ